MTTHTAPAPHQDATGMWLCPGCDAFPYFTKDEALECMARHGEPTEGCDAEGQETFGPTARTVQDLDLAEDECRWTKAGNDWAVRGPARLMAEGSTLTVTNRSGATKVVTIGAPMLDSRNRWDSEPMAIARPVDDRPARQAPAEVPEGLHLLDGTAYKVVTSQAGRRYAKVLQGTKWVYDAGAVRNLSAATAATKEQAAEYGKLTGVCCCCGRTLTNPDSIAKGIGPVCEAGF